MAPLAAGAGIHTVLEQSDTYLGFYRMRHLRTMDGGGIQVMVVIPSE